MVDTCHKNTWITVPFFNPSTLEAEAGDPCESEAVLSTLEALDYKLHSI